jgi:hypothetical protein
MQLDQVFGIAADAIELGVKRFRIGIGQDVTTKRLSKPSGVASMRAMTRRSRPQDLAP